MRETFLQRESESGKSTHQKEIILQQQIEGLRTNVDVLEKQRERLEEENNRLLIAADRRDREIELSREQTGQERKLKEKAERLLEERELNHKEQIQKKEEKIENYSEDKDTLRNQFEQERADFRAEIEVLKTSIQRSERKDITGHAEDRAEHSRIKKANLRLEEQLESVRAMIKQREEIIAIKEKRLLELERERGDVTQNSEESQKKKLELEIQLVENQEKLENERKQTQKEREKNDDLKNQHEKAVGILREQVGGLKAKIEELETRSKKTGEQGGNAEVLKYENEKLKKNAKKLEMKVAQLKGSEKSNVKERARLERRLDEASKLVDKISQLENDSEKSGKELLNLQKAYQSSEMRLKDSVQKIGNALYMLESVRFKGKKDKDRLMNALIGVS